MWRWSSYLSCALGKVRFMQTDRQPVDCNFIYQWQHFPPFFLGTHFLKWQTIVTRLQIGLYKSWEENEMKVLDHFYFIYSLSINLSIIFWMNWLLVVWSVRSTCTHCTAQMSCFVYNSKIFSLLSEKSKKPENILFERWALNMSYICRISFRIFYLLGNPDKSSCDLKVTTHCLGMADLWVSSGCVQYP